MTELSTKADKNSARPKVYLLLHGIVLLYSLAGICSKMAAQNAFLTLPFCLWYGGVLVILVVYALLWQQVLKHLPLTTAYANKAVTIIWGILWGMLIFGESLSIFMIIGAALVFVGVLLVVTSDE